ncbi:aa3-type cytochrome c oxidase subunit IV [Frigidibacter sp. MR17.24]
MADHQPGKMDITVQEKTFAGFIRATTWVAGFVIVLLVFLALVNG